MAYSKPSGDGIENATSMAVFDEERKLGSGTFGRAFLVKDRATGKFYVVEKVDLASMRHAGGSNNDAMELVEMIFEGTNIMKDIKHGNIVKVYTSFEVYDIFHIVMEYCDGGTLKQAIRRKADEGPNSYFAEDRVCRWMAQISMALTWLHDRNIMHRDIKADHIFLMSDEEQTLKLGGFICVQKPENIADSDPLETPTPISPELLSGEPCGFKSEVWAFGVVAYELVTLELPFPYKGNFFAMLTTVINDPIPPIPEARCGQGLRDLIEKKMLVRDVDKRATMAEVNDYIKRMKAEAEAKQWEWAEAEMETLSDGVNLETKQLAELQAGLLASEEQAKAANGEATAALQARQEIAEHDMEMKTLTLGERLQACERLAVNLKDEANRSIVNSEGQLQQKINESAENVSELQTRLALTEQRIVNLEGQLQRKINETAKKVSALQTKLALAEQQPISMQDANRRIEALETQVQELKCRCTIL